MGLLRAILDGILGEVNLAGGRAVTRLDSVLTAAEVGSMAVESTLRFGEYTDGASDARLLINGEIVTATGRTSAAPFAFTGLTRAVDGTKAIAHPVGALVIDLAQNTSAIDLTRRGFFVDFAIGEDLNVIGRNLGLRKCPGISDTTWRRIIRALGYLPKTTVDAFDTVLEALMGNTTSYEIWERLVSDPYQIFVAIEVALATSVRGRFILTGGHPELTTGLNAVEVSFGGVPVQLRTVNGVYLDTIPTRRGRRDGVTNFYAGGGVFVPGTNVITLGASPGAIGTAVLVDYTAYGADPTISYHYLADDETIRDDQDRYAYLSDPLRAVRCLLDQVRPAGTRVDVSVKM